MKKKVNFDGLIEGILEVYDTYMVNEFQPDAYRQSEALLKEMATYPVIRKDPSTGAVYALEYAAGDDVETVRELMEKTISTDDFGEPLTVRDCLNVYIQDQIGTEWLFDWLESHREEVLGYGKGVEAFDSLGDDEPLYPLFVNDEGEFQMSVLLSMLHNKIVEVTEKMTMKELMAIETDEPKGRRIPKRFS